MDESEGLLTLEELQKIKASRTYAQAVQLLKNAAGGATLSSAEFTLVRDFLLTRFSLDTGTRPGPLNNATIQEYQKAKVKDGCKVMLVARHKRAKDGPAITPMLPELYGFMETYVNILRPRFAKAGESALFVTIDGISFKENTIGRRLTSFVEKCGVQLAGRMAFVDMRKKISTEMLNRCNPEERAILRRVLAHSEKTSRKWYARPDLTETGAEAVKIIQRLLDPSEKAKYIASKVFKTSTLPATSASATDKTPTTPPSSEYVAPSSYSALTNMQKEELREACMDNILDGNPVKMEDMRELVVKKAILRILASSEAKLKQAVNYVNYLVKKSNTASPPASVAAPQEKVSTWLDTFDKPLSRSSNPRRTEWDPEEASILERAFKSFDTLPPTSKIRTVLSGNKRLTAIVERDGWARVYNKLKNIYRNKK